MRLVEPQVFLLGEMALDHAEVAKWLNCIGGDEAVKCLDHLDGSDLERLIELLARRCYKSFAPGLNPNVKRIRTNSSEYHKNILEQKHGSVEAHGHCTFAFENVSRVFTHEVVRNSVGNDMSQESLRYVRLEDISFWIPPIIAKERERKVLKVSAGTQAMSVDSAAMSPSDIFRLVVETCEWAQKALAEYYNIDDVTDFEVKKKLTSAFRRVAPEGLATGIGMTFQIRSLRWIIEQRTSRAAEEEIRVVFDKVAQIAVERWPMVFQDFERVPDSDLPNTLAAWVPKNSKI